MKHGIVATVLFLAYGSAAVAATRPNEPGAIIASDAAVVCAPGYASAVRPRGIEWRRLKEQLYVRERLPRGHRYGYVADHIVPLELGGAPRDLRNLWLEPYAEAHEKDRVENELHVLVCDHRMALPDAQARIARDWTTAVPAGTVFTPNERAWLQREGYSDY